MYVCDDISVCMRRVCVCHDLNCFFDYTSRLIMNITGKKACRSP